MGAVWTRTVLSLRRKLLHKRIMWKSLVSHKMIDKKLNSKNEWFSAITFWEMQHSFCKTGNYHKAAFDGKLPLDVTMRKQALLQATRCNSKRESKIASCFGRWELFLEIAVCKGNPELKPIQCRKPYTQIPSKDRRKTLVCTGRLTVESNFTTRRSRK